VEDWDGYRGSSECPTAIEIIAASYRSLQALTCDAIAYDPPQRRSYQRGVTYPQLRGIRREGVVAIPPKHNRCVFQVPLRREEVGCVESSNRANGEHGDPKKFSHAECAW
jgi:hypothetical protein